MTILQFATALNPAGYITQNVSNILGVNVGLNVPKTINPFFYSPFDVVNAPTISCTLYTALSGTTDTGNTIPLSVQYASATPYRTYNLVGNVGNVFTSFQVTEQMTCPISNSSYPPNLAGGTSTLIWTATNAAGQPVTITNSVNSIQPTTSGGQSISLPTGTTPLTGITLYTWTITAAQIQSILGVNTLVGANFQSLQQITVSNSLTFYQGNVVSVPWTIANAGPSMISYTLQEISPAPLAVASGTVNLAILSPNPATINLQTSPVVNLQVTESNWNTNLGNPELKLYYSDPSNVNAAGTPIIDVFLQPNQASLGQSGTTFNFNYAFPSTASLGRYTFKASQSGNINTAAQDIYVTSNTVSCATGQYFDGSTNQCKNIATVTCSNGSVITSGQICPTPTTPATTPVPNPNPNPFPTNSCLTNILTCLGQFNVNSLNFSQLLTATSLQTAISLAVILALIFVVFIAGAIALHHHKKQQGEDGIALDIRPESD